MTTTSTKLHLPAGTAGGDGLDVWVSPASADWDYSGLAVLTLAPGESRQWSTGDAETLVLPLAGSCQVTSDG